MITALTLSMHVYHCNSFLFWTVPLIKFIVSTAFFSSLVHSFDGPSLFLLTPISVFFIFDDISLFLLYLCLRGKSPCAKKLSDPPSKIDDTMNTARLQQLNCNNYCHGKVIRVLIKLWIPRPLRIIPINLNDTLWPSPFATTNKILHSAWWRCSFLRPSTVKVGLTQVQGISSVARSS